MKLQLCLVVCFGMLASCTFGGNANTDQGLLAEPLYNESIMDGQANDDFSRASGLSSLIDNPLSYRGLNEANKDDILEPDEKSTGLGDSNAKRARPHRNNQRRRPIIRGKYRFLAPDGTIRTIKYISDQNGIRHVVPSRQTDNLSLTTLSDGIKNRLGMTNTFAPLPVLPLGVGLQSPSNGIYLEQQSNKLGFDYSLEGQYAPVDNVVVVTPRPTQLTSQFGLTPLLMPQQIDNIGFGQLPLTGLPTLGNLFPVQQFRLPFNAQQFMPRQLRSNQDVQDALPGRNVYHHPAIRQENFLPGYGHGSPLQVLYNNTEINILAKRVLILHASISLHNAYKQQSRVGTYTSSMTSGQNECYTINTFTYSLSAVTLAVGIALLVS